MGPKIASTTGENDDKLLQVADQLAKRVTSAEGAASRARAAADTVARSAKISEAARFNPEVLQKRVTA